ncbi:unnamed protein product [Auanema sp. JU1783]|nr:unnamed protein product [Auanema sp. JU1783]
MSVIRFPPIPFETPIYKGMNHDAVITINGDVFPGHQHGFVVELVTSDGIAFHMSNRMSVGGGEHTIVLNTQRHGKWEKEERHSQCFHFGRPFQLELIAHHKHLSVYVGGHHVCDFHIRHSNDLHHVRSLVIRGDVRVSEVQLSRFHH